MLTETNRKGIRDSVKQWSQRRNIPDDVLNDFIELAMSKANRALRIPPLETANLFEVDDAGYFTIPQDFLEVKEIVIERNGNAIILERKAIHEVDWQNNHYGNPCYFGRYGDKFRIGPWDGDDDDTTISTARMYYWYVIPPMPTDSTENWFTLYAPEVLLYGALAELSNYTRDEGGVALWDAKFREAIDIIQRVEDRAAWSGGPLGISIGGSH